MSHPAGRSFVLSVILALVFALVAGVAVAPTETASAATGSTGHVLTTEVAAQSNLLVLVNRARASAGLRALRSDPRLTDLARNRARWMADRNELTHTSYGGDIAPAVDSTGIDWLFVGEAVAMSSVVPGADIAPRLFEMWRGSPPHWGLITSSDFNYVGIGIGLTANGDPYGALVFAETLDRTAPVATTTSATASGATATWRWSGSDVALQTHTAGLCTFDVQMRDGAAAWRLLKSKTTTRTLALGSRTPGHTYSVRVRARDCQGNLSSWTAPRSVRIG